MNYLISFRLSVSDDHCLAVFHIAYTDEKVPNNNLTISFIILFK